MEKGAAGSCRSQLWIVYDTEPDRVRLRCDVLADDAEEALAQAYARCGCPTWAVLEAAKPFRI